MQIKHQELTRTQIEEWLVSYLAETLEIDKNEVDIKVPFTRYGLDSSSAVVMTGDLETFLGLEIEATVPYDYPTIEALAQYLEQQKKAG